MGEPLPPQSPVTCNRGRVPRGEAPRLRAESRARRTWERNCFPWAGSNGAYRSAEERRKEREQAVGVRFCKSQGSAPWRHSPDPSGCVGGDSRRAPQPLQRRCPPPTLLRGDALHLPTPPLAPCAQPHLSSRSESLRGSREAWPRAARPFDVRRRRCDWTVACDVRGLRWARVLRQPQRQPRLGLRLPGI